MWRLIILDHEMQVMRFAHLSVQEYLETRKDSWGIIDAERFVSEACLWALQCGPSAIPALYDYSSHNWFRHCRSYQDIALVQNTPDPNHSLDIPILNTFLGSFNDASVRFGEWVGWLMEYTQSHWHQGRAMYRSILSTPLTPAFTAAVCGLGELVSWLWYSEGADMNIKNDENYSLLHLASEYGTTWIISCVITRAADLDINEVCNSATALTGAVQSGVLENVTLLLDEGADINLTLGEDYDTPLEAAAANAKLVIARLLLDRGADVNLISDGEYGTALGAAAFCGELEMATLLLDRGADINLIPGGKCGTALEAAAYGGELEIATLLLDRGADINLVSGGECGTALGVAAYGGELEIVTLLLDRGADINIIYGGEYGTALAAAVASRWGKPEVTKLLLDRGANPDLANHLGQKPRDLARGSDEVVSMLDSYSAGRTESQMNHSQVPADGSKDGEPCREER